MKITLSRGNKKLGKILNWSLPPVTTCSNKTTLCTKFCYAVKSYKQYPNVRKAWDNNYLAALDPNFDINFNTELGKWAMKGYNTVRLHVSGDFFNKEYLHNIVKIAIQNPSITFYGYTKQWRDISFLPLLELMNALPNCTIFCSTDQETINNGEAPPSSFREATVVLRKGVLKGKMNLLHCPQQVKATVTCDKCKFCFNPKLKTSNRGVVFIEH